MPRKTPAPRQKARLTMLCFNEAAARCRGKLGRAGREAMRLKMASMRPRPDAAENAKVRIDRDRDA